MSSKAKKTILIAVAAVCILVCVGSGLFLYQYYHGVQVESRRNLKPMQRRPRRSR